MEAESPFAELMDRFRRGDDAAAAELVHRFGPQIRRAIRVRATGTRLGRVLDSEDLMQDVLRTLWERRAEADLRVQGPGQLVAWLLAVARNRRTERQRESLSHKRGGKHAALGSAALAALPENGKSPASEIADRERLQQVLARLEPDERRIAEARADGTEWADLAAERDTTPDALRNRQNRAVAKALRPGTEPPG